MIVSPLHRYHVSAGARFLEWGGWQIPAFYTSPMDELCCIRTLAGYTDYPALRHIVVRGQGAFAILQRLCSRNLERCPAGKAVFTLVLNEDGSIIEDGILLRLADDLFVMSVVGRNSFMLPAIPRFMELKEPQEWLRASPEAHVCIHELGAFLISVQGPRSRELLRPAANLDDLAPFSVREAKIGGIPVIVARTGYSGELGFEFLVWPEHAPDLWELIAKLGEAHGARPYGVKATMIMGLEKGYLNKRDFYPGSTPLEVGLGWAVDLGKPDFVGKQAVLRRREQGTKTRLVGIELPSSVPTPVHGDPVLVSGKILGKITNAGVSPRLDRTLARAWLPLEMAAIDTEVEVLTKGALLRASVRPSYCWYDPHGLRRA